MASPNGTSSHMRNGTSPTHTTRYQNAAYYFSSSIYEDLTPTQLESAYLTMLYYASASVAKDGTVQLGDLHADTRANVGGHEGCLRACLALRERNPNLKILLSVGNGDSSQAFPSIIEHRDSMERFSRSAKSLVDQYDLDGIDICWQTLPDKDAGDDLLRLLQRVRGHFPDGFLLTTAVPGHPAGIKKMSDLQSMSAVVDYFNLFAMDFCGPYSALTGHHSQLYEPLNQEMSCHFLVNQLNIPARKIILGIPTYGRSFKGATHIGQRFNSVGGVNGIFQYKDLPRPDARENFDREAHAAFCTGGDGGFVSYDNPNSVWSKATYVTHNNMAGLFYSNAMSDAVGDRSLIKAGWQRLSNTPR